MPGTAQGLRGVYFWPEPWSETWSKVITEEKHSKEIKYFTVFILRDLISISMFFSTQSETIQNLRPRTWVDHIGNEIINYYKVQPNVILQFSRKLNIYWMIQSFIWSFISAETGGLLGAVLGASIISVVETLYFGVLIVKSCGKHMYRKIVDWFGYDSIAVRIESINRFLDIRWNGSWRLTNLGKLEF